MEQIEYHAPLGTKCQCLQLPVGTLLRYDRYYDYIRVGVPIRKGTIFEGLRQGLVSPDDFGYIVDVDFINRHIVPNITL